jgi:hypothetical protein
VGSSGHPLLQALCASLALGCVGEISSCTVRVWECLQSPVGRGSGPACMCPLMSMGCRRVPAGYVLFVPVLFMWNVVVLLLMHLLGRRGFICVCNRVVLHKYRNKFLHAVAPSQLSLSQNEYGRVHPDIAVLLIPFVLPSHIIRKACLPYRYSHVIPV